MTQSYKYIGRWSSYDSMVLNFFCGCNGDSYCYHESNTSSTPPDNMPTDDQILLAVYGGASYEGSAFVIYQQDGKYYEVNGSHCSCYGLEGQWKPEETTIEAIKMRLFNNEHYEMEESEVEAITSFLSSF